MSEAGAASPFRQSRPFALVKAAALAQLLMALLALAAPQGAFAAARAPLIVVSLDGFRADYYDRGLTPTLATLAADGARAISMTPSFPSVTEPNHYTLMTGLYPDHHGIVDNTMVDPKMPGMAFGGPHGHGVDNDPRWWDEATPLWVTAQNAGLKTATSMWPGQDAVIHGVAPTYIQDPPQPRPLIFPMDKQVDQVLAWLDLPADQRPALIRLHFDLVDLMGHVAGPNSAAVNDAIVKVDKAMAALVDGLKARDLYDKVNLVVVSDHGMTDVSAKKIVFLDDMIDLKAVVVTTSGAETGVNRLPGHEAEIEKIMLEPHPHMQCWRKRDIPARLHYGTNPRVPAIFCLAELGWTLTTREEVARYPALLGEHGYDPAEPTMAAIFIAHGPAFKTGVTLATFENVNLYPMLAKVLGVRPRPNDGRLSVLAPALAAP